MSEAESVKVVLLGESGVGKTSIISQFTIKQFNPRCQSSVSAQFTSKNVEFPELNQTIKFDIWDTVGQEKYRSLAKIFYKDAKVIIFVYDITTKFSFQGIKDYWYSETQSNADKNPLLAVVANKSDLYSEQQVSDQEGKAFADEIGAIFQSTSALSDFGINKLFENIGRKYLMPGFDYKAEDNKKAEEDFVKKKQEQQEEINKKKKGLKLSNKTEENAQGKKCCG